MNKGSIINRSGAMVAGGTSQLVAKKNVERKYFVFQNLSAENMYLGFGKAAPAGAGSILLPPMGSYETPAHFVITSEIWVRSATTASAFTCLEA